MLWEEQEWSHFVKCILNVCGRMISKLSWFTKKGKKATIHPKS